MTTTGTRGSTPAAASQLKPSSPSGPINGFRVGPVITTVASVVSAVIVFGLGVLVGTGVAAVLGLHGSSRSGVMLALGVVFGLTSIVASARRHLPRT